ncbi:MAG: arylsulfatase [Gemmataceae bacterium]|nr:arylsulfatase [Gemmataceae bacterium]
MRCWFLIGCFLLGVSAAQAEPPPNVVLIFADDLGYADLGCFGAKKIRTPNLDSLARDGARFTNFHVPQAVCSASRTALLTGCYPNRVGILGALGPGAKNGIKDSEFLIPEHLKKLGYATAIFGKWHLGDSLQYSPLRHGFDTYFGLPYSNDMWPGHPTNKKFPPLPLRDGDKVLEANPDQTKLTGWYTDRGLQFIEANKDKPFFLYMPHSMPHVPLFASEKFRGKSAQGLLGDVIEEIDASVGAILAALKKHDLEKNTLVIFTSDNGPWLSYGHHAGSAGPLREGKGTEFEGGVRVPFLARWPGRIPAGSVSNQPAMTIDLLPTLVEFAGGQVPATPKIDGKSLAPLLLFKPGAKSPQEAYFFYWGNALHAVSSTKWKLHFPHPYIHLLEGGKDGLPGKMETRKTGLALYNLEMDLGESKNVAEGNPDVVKQLQKLADGIREELGDTLTGKIGKENR